MSESRRAVTVQECAPPEGEHFCQRKAEISVSCFDDEPDAVCVSISECGETQVIMLDAAGASAVAAALLAPFASLDETPRAAVVLLPEDCE